MTTYRGYQGYTPEAIKNNRRVGLEQVLAGSDASPVQHWTQALARVVQGGVGGLRQSDSERAHQQGLASGNQALAKALAGGSPEQAATAMMGNPFTAQQGQQLAVSAINSRAASGRATERQRAQMEAQRQRDAAQHARAKELLQMRLEASTAKGGQTKYGLNPIYGRDANGNIVLLQPGTDGTAAQTAIPEGVTVDPSLAPEARARGSAVGKSTGVAQSDLANVEHDTGILLNQIDALRNDPYLSSMTGGSAYFPNVTPRAHEVQARIDQLGGKAFLQAFQKLKGAGQITEMEGMRAEKALTRLSNVHQGDDAYKEALDEFRAEVVKLLENAKRKAGMPTDNKRRFKVLR